MMKTILIILVIGCIGLIQCEPPKRPVQYSNFQSKSKIPLRTIMLQFRNGGRPTLHIKGPQMLSQRIRPHKHVPYQFVKSHSGGMAKRPNHMTPKPFQSSQPGPHTGEYVFENPFLNQQMNKLTTVQPIQMLQIQSNRQPQNSIRFTIDNQSPIHTIPAPNLASLGGGKIQQFADFTYPHDNHISLTDGGSSVFHSYPTSSPFTVTPVPVRYHQYQVTEDLSNDHTMQDPFSGVHKLYAPDPDPSLSTRGVTPAHDPFSKPSNGNSLPFDVAASASLNQQLFQFIDPIPQQQLPDSYGLPINSQPQLQQHLLQQASLVPSMPLSVYNPTYLVTQSNSLFNQHQQQQQQQNQLFKPEPSFLTAYNQPAFSKQYQQFNFQNQDLQSGGLQHVASPGQVFAASQDNDPFLAAASQNIQTAAQFIDQGSQRPNSHELTKDEYQNWLQLQKIHDIESTSYPYEYTSQQQQNDELIQQANQEALRNQYYHSSPAPSTSATASSIHNQHQSLLAQKFSSSLSPMRIYVPDDDSGYQKLQHRSDDDDDEETVYDNLSSEEAANDVQTNRNRSKEGANSSSSENETKDEQQKSS